MKHPKDVVCLVIDNGLFGQRAVKLAKTYGEVGLLPVEVGVKPAPRRCRAGLSKRG